MTSGTDRRPPRQDRLGVVIDIQSLQNPLHRERGIGRYTVDHVDALLELDAPIVALVVDPTRPTDGVPQRWRDAGLVEWNDRATMRVARARTDRLVYHVASPAEPSPTGDGIFGPTAAVADCLSVTLFDLIPLRFPEWYQRRHVDVALHRRRGTLVRNADVVLTISEHTRHDAITLLGCRPERVVYQGTGLSRAFAADADAGAPDPALPSEIRRRFVLTVPGWGEPRKDPTTTFAAWARLPAAVRAEHQLVVVCALPEAGADAWRQQCRALGLRDDEVVFTGRVDDAVLRRLYRTCAAMVFVSVAEGFGLPALEAAAAGAPVLVSDSTSLPEVLDTTAALVPLGDADALATSIARVLTEPAFAAQLRDAGRTAVERHQWPLVARRTIAAWEHSTRPSARPRAFGGRASSIEAPALALLGPMPPSKSGIGTFNARVVDALTQSGVIVDVFGSGDDRMPPPPGSRHHRQFPVEAFGRAFGPAHYDAVVHTIGNAHYHREVLAHARATPGIVWLHEVQLAGLYLTEAGIFRPGLEPGPREIERARTAMRMTTERVHQRPAEGIDDLNWWHTDVYDRLGFTFTRELVAGARAVIVSTRAAADAIHDEVPPGTPLHVLPLPFPTPVSTPPRSDSDSGSDAPWIVSLGWVDPIKQPDLLIDAVARVHTRTPVRLAFVGELGDATRADLERHAADRGIADLVVFTGFTDPDEYAQWLDRATVVVQLRAASRGEASAALNDAIAAGRATITNIATARELPTDVVVHLDVTTPDTVADAITGLLNDDTRRDTIRRHAARHAASWTFERLADHLLEIVASLPPQPGP